MSAPQALSFAVAAVLALAGLGIQILGLRQGVRTFGKGKARYFAMPMRPWSITAIVLWLVALALLILAF